MRRRYDYDDDNEMYREAGSSYIPEDDPGYGYDNYDGYDEWERKTYSPRNEHTAPRSLDFSKVEPQGYEDGDGYFDEGRERPRGKRYSRNGERAPEKLDFSNAYIPKRAGTGRDELSRYLDYLEQYDSGDIDNYEMSRIQRAFADKPFWDTFQPSRDLIRKYGSGNESTRWPMFRREGSRWVPEIWRND